MNASLSLATELRRPLRVRWLLAFLVLAAFFAINAWLQPSLLTWRVLASNLTSFLPLVLVAIGQTYVVLAGDIDLSAGAIIALVNVSVVSLIEHTGGGGGAIALGLAAGVALGTICGLLNGFLVAVIRLQAIVTTFATSIVFGGAALWILPQAGGSVPQAYWRGYAGSLGPVKLTVILFLVAVGISIVFSRMRWYRHLLAIGGNRLGAFQTGLPVTRQRVTSYVICGIFSALAALCLVGETASADPLLGPSFTLTSISAVVLGGTALAGGRGGVIGSILGALTLGLINNIVFFAKLPYVTQDLVKGLIILAALAGGILGARR